MARSIWQKTITDEQGNIQEGVQITVEKQSGGLADISANQSGSASKSNPFLTGTDGVARFFAEPDFYKITAFKNGESVIFDWNNIGDNRLREDLAKTDSDVLIAGFPARNFNDKINELDGEFADALTGYQGDVDQFIEDNQSFIEKTKVEEELKSNAAFYANFTQDYALVPTGLSKVASGVAAAITMTNPDGITGIGADSKIYDSGVGNVPIVYDGEGHCQGLQSAPSGTNLFTHSSDYTQSDWSKTASDLSVALSSDDSPVFDESGTAEKWNRIESNSNNSASRYFNQNRILEAGRGSVQIIAKGGEVDAILIRLSGAGINAEARITLNLNDGSTVANSGYGDINGSMTVELLAQGSYRIKISFDVANNNTVQSFFHCGEEGSLSVTTTLSTGDGFFATAAQLEQGYPTPYIKTEGSQVTIGAVTPEKDGLSVPSSFSLYFSGRVLSLKYNASGPILYIGNSDATQRLQVSSDSSIRTRFTARVDGSNVLTSGDNGKELDDSLHKYVIVKDGLSIKLFLDGELDITDTLSADLKTELFDRIRWGTVGSGSGENMLLKESALTPYAVTDAEAIALTTLEDA